MTDRQKRYPPFGWLLISILFGAALLDIVVFYILPLRYLYPGTFDEGAETPAVAAVLFNDFNPSFTGINNETKRRVRHGAAMLKQNRVEQLIVVGGNRAASKRKGARLMADYLLELGVPEEKILIEDSSRDSVSNLEQLGRILSERNISTLGLISSPYHLLRLKTMRIPFNAILLYYPYNPADCSPPLSRSEIWHSAHYNGVALALRLFLPEPLYRKLVMWVREHTEW